MNNAVFITCLLLIRQVTWAIYFTPLGIPVLTCETELFEDKPVADARVRGTHSRLHACHVQRVCACMC